ncbi:MAG: hypothetical protein WCO25_04330 [Candidatus Uhrbacteria bacterium]
METTCTNCKKEVDALKAKCAACGLTLTLEPDEARRARSLRMPSLGALLFTQGWTLGARTYLLFLLSLIPVVGLGVLVVAVLFGRRLSWKHGEWASWEEFEERMHWLDLLSFAWVGILAIGWLFLRK